MNRFIKLSAIFTVALFLVSCSSINVYKDKNVYTKNKPIILSENIDGSGTYKELKSLLEASGYEVIMLGIDRNAKVINPRFELKSNKEIQTDSLKYTIGYDLKLDYTYSYNSFFTCFYSSFMAIIIDIETEEVVMALKLKGNKNSIPLLKEFVEHTKTIIK